DLVEAADASIHLHRLVEAISVRCCIAAPATFAHDDRRDVAVEGFADARLDTAVCRAAADEDRVATQHVQKLGDSRPVKGARPALQKYVILGPGRDLVGEAGLRRALD